MLFSFGIWRNVRSTMIAALSLSPSPKFVSFKPICIYNMLALWLWLIFLIKSFEWGNSNLFYCNRAGEFVLCFYISMSLVLFGLAKWLFYIVKYNFVYLLLYFFQRLRDWSEWNWTKMIFLWLLWSSHYTFKWIATAFNFRNGFLIYVFRLHYTEIVLQNYFQSWIFDSNNFCVMTQFFFSLWSFSWFGMANFLLSLYPLLLFRP